MTREEAVEIWLNHGSARSEQGIRRVHPEHRADKMLIDNAEDCIDGLVALGLLTLEEPDTSEVVLQDRGRE